VFTGRRDTCVDHDNKAHAVGVVYECAWIAADGAQAGCFLRLGIVHHVIHRLDGTLKHIAFLSSESCLCKRNQGYLFGCACHIGLLALSATLCGILCTCAVPAGA
jgi:hypothetical protein